MWSWIWIFITIDKKEWIHWSSVPYVNKPFSAFFAIVIACHCNLRFVAATLSLSSMRVVTSSHRHHLAERGFHRGMLVFLEACPRTAQSCIGIHSSNLQTRTRDFHYRWSQR
jgi:hypothetical protein